MKQKLTIINYGEFVLDNILRPYQLTLGFENRIKDSEFTEAYKAILETGANNTKWKEMVFGRLFEIYDKIDFSFFPNDATAEFIKEELIRRGVLDITLDGDK